MAAIKGETLCWSCMTHHKSDGMATINGRARCANCVRRFARTQAQRKNDKKHGAWLKANPGAKRR